MLPKYTVDLYSKIIRDASKCDGFKNNPKVREQFRQAMNRVCAAWSGENTNRVLTELDDEITLADVASRSALLNWFQNGIGPAL